MMREIDLQNQIRLALDKIAITFRANVGIFYTRDGRPISTGLPKGFSDLFGFRRSDGRIFFLEIKTANGRLSKDQKSFLAAMSKLGAITGVARSVEDALEVLKE